MASTHLVCHHVCALTKVVRTLMLPNSWWNTGERTLTLLEEVSITSGKFSIALYYEKTISGEYNGTNNSYRETYKGFLCYCLNIY